MRVSRDETAWKRHQQHVNSSGIARFASKVHQGGGVLICGEPPSDPVEFAVLHVEALAAPDDGVGGEAGDPEASGHNIAQR